MNIGTGKSHFATWEKLRLFKQGRHRARDGERTNQGTSKKASYKTSTLADSEQILKHIPTEGK